MKISLVGSGGVGKTAITTRIVTGKYLETTMTVGVNIETWTLEDPASGSVIKAATFDLGGQDHFKFLHETMILGSHLLMLVFDVTNYQSLLDLRTWSEYLGREKHPACILVGNKIDLHPAFSEDEVILVAEELDVPHILVSAKTGDNFDRLEHLMVETLNRELN